MIFFDRNVTGSHIANFSRTLAVLIAVAAGPAFAAETPLVLTLDDAVKMGLERNIDVELARRDLLSDTGLA